MSPIRFGTRGSALARWQTEDVVRRLRATDDSLSIEIVTISSAGDQSPDVPIDLMEGTGFFTSAIERALERREVDVAVHSCKDLPVDSNTALTIAALLERAPVEDVLIARDHLSLADLPAGSRIGTCSLRRTAQLRAIRQDFDYLPLRGNLPTRVERVTAGDLDAVVIARAGLERLGLMAHVTEIFPTDKVLPAPAQGAVAVQTRADETAIIELLSRLDHAATRRAVEAERRLLHGLGGGCSVPVGALGRIKEDALVLEAAVFELTSGRALRANARGTDTDRVADDATRQLIDAGAVAILEAAGRSSAAKEAQP